MRHTHSADIQRQPGKIWVFCFDTQKEDSADMDLIAGDVTDGPYTCPHCGTVMTFEIQVEIYDHPAAERGEETFSGPEDFGGSDFPESYGPGPMPFNH